jgi:phospholipase/carboxylesterase
LTGREAWVKLFAMPRELLLTVEIEPKGPARASVIWLHGLGADGHDFEPIVPYLGIPDTHGVRFVFPHAPRRAVSINMGLIMPAWYDIRDMGLRHDEDEEGIQDSAERVTDLIAREEERGVAASRIVLAGFSQGGAIALHVGLRHPGRLAGILAMSTYLVRESTLATEASEANRDVPIFLAHGTADPMVPFWAGEQAGTSLRALGYRVQWMTYPIGHEVNDEEIRDVGAWLARKLDPSAS